MKLPQGRLHRTRSAISIRDRQGLEVEILGEDASFRLRWQVALRASLTFYLFTEQSLAEAHFVGAYF